MFCCNKRIDKSLILSSRSSKLYALIMENYSRPGYLKAISSPQIRKAFAALQLWTMPSAFLTGRYLRIPAVQREFVLRDGQIENFFFLLLIVQSPLGGGRWWLSQPLSSLTNSPIHKILFCWERLPVHSLTCCCSMEDPREICEKLTVTSVGTFLYYNSLFGCTVNIY